MTTLELQFPANRYHGTAWGRHVNEGIAEWPPSPYRLLRALYDAWKRKWDTSISEAEIQAIFERLSSDAPTFYLPPVVAAHTRSYLSSNTLNPQDKALIFDGFVAMKRDARCFLEWKTELGASERRNLRALLESLNYLGRSESWVQGNLAESEVSGIRWAPTSGAQNVTYVACPVPRADYKHKQPAWLDALALSSRMLFKQKLSTPPAMRYVSYGIPDDALTSWLPMRPRYAGRHLSAAVLELRGRVLPGVADTVRVAERIRGRLMRYFESRGLRIPAMVHGKDDDGVPLKDHLHVFILPRANRLGRIDHALIYTRDPDGFSKGIDDAIANVHTIRWIESIRAVSAWVGPADDQEIRPMARRVRNSTPFITVRHWRKGRETFLEDEILRECKNHQLPEPVNVKPSELPVMQFRRNREGEPSRAGYALEVEFPEPVRTPFSLGYGCHFGLGQFEKA